MLYRLMHRWAILLYDVPTGRVTHHSWHTFKVGARVERAMIDSTSDAHPLLVTRREAERTVFGGA